MNIVKKEYIYVFNQNTLADALNLNNAYGGTGAGGVSSPSRGSGFTFVIIVDRHDPDKGAIFVTTYNEQNFEHETKDLINLSFSPFGEPLNPTE